MFTASNLNGIAVVGCRAKHPTHWLLPIQSRQPDQLVHALWKAGFDATRGATSMFAVRAEGHYAEAKDAHIMMHGIVYLPVESGAKSSELSQLAETVKALENNFNDEADVPASLDTPVHTTAATAAKSVASKRQSHQ
jgi:hypothetical protein